MSAHCPKQMQSQPEDDWADVEPQLTITLQDPDIEITQVIQKEHKEQCNVCFKSDLTVIVCTFCKQGVHQDCYGKPIENQWQCEKCQFIISGANTQVQCQYCCEPKGIFRHLDNGAWVHVSCVKLIPEIQFSYNTIKGTVHKYRFTRNCYVCKTPSSGVVLPCDYKQCSKNVHINCAIDNKLVDKQNKAIFCHQHFDKAIHQIKLFGIREVVKSGGDCRFQFDQECEGRVNQVCQPKRKRSRSRESFQSGKVLDELTMHMMQLTYAANQYTKSDQQVPPVFYDELLDTATQFFKYLADQKRKRNMAPQQQQQQQQQPIDIDGCQSFDMTKLRQILEQIK